MEQGERRGEPQDASGDPWAQTLIAPAGTSPLSDCFDDADLSLRTCGKAIFFTATLMTIGLAPWYFLSELKFLSDMGLLLVTVMLYNMVLALILLPLLVYMLKPRFLDSDISALSESLEKKPQSAVPA